MFEELFIWFANTYRTWPKTQATGAGEKAGPSLAGTDRQPPLRLFPGQVVRAMVLETEPGSAKVSVDGHILWAALKTTVTAGRTVWLEVERVVPGIHFRLLSDEALTDEEWPQLLRALKLPVTDRLMAAVRYLSENRLPFDARMLRQLLQWRQGAYLNEQGVQAAVHLQMRGFPLRFPLFFAVYQALSDHRQQRSALFTTPALAPLLPSENEPVEASTFRLDRWWQRLIHALRSQGENAAPGESGKGGERAVVLLGHAILQYPVTYGDAWAIYLFPLPPWLPFSGWLQLAVPREASRRWPPAGHLLMQLEMPHLKATQIRIYWQDKILSLTIVTEQPLPEEERREEEERLRANLAKLGFVVRSVHWQRLEEPPTFRWFQEGVDIRC